MPQPAEKIRDGAILLASGDKNVLCHVITPHGAISGINKGTTGTRDTSTCRENTKLTDAYPGKVSPQHLTLSRAETTKHRKALWGEVEGQALGPPEDGLLTP